MRKLVLVFIIVALAVPAYAQKDISVGLFGGFNAPIVQEDVESGAAYGIHVKYSPIPLVAAGAFAEFRSYGDPSIDVGGTSYPSDGGKATAFGIEGMIGSTGGGVGPHFYWILGLGSYKWTRDNRDDLSKIAFHLGPGIEIVLPSNIGLEARAKFEIINLGDDATRKNVIVTFGANYHFAIM